MAEQRDKSLNSLASTASLHIFETKVWVNLIAGKTPALRPGCLALNDSSIFLDKEGGSLENSFSVALSCSSVKPLYRSSIIISFLTCEVIFCGSSVIVSRAAYAPGLLIVIDSHLDITSDHMPGSPGRTSITPDFVHAGGRVNYYRTRQTLLRCDSTGDLYPLHVATSAFALLTNNHSLWNQHLGHPGDN
ncbi:hypothetical protein Tco_1269630, partial [Tanacetum coccineum]